MKVAIVFCFVALALVSAESPADAPLLTEEQLTEQVTQLAARAARIGGALQRFKEVGVGQIRKLKELIDANRHCEAIASIPSPDMPVAPTEASEDEQPAPQLDLQAASNIVHRLQLSITLLEQKIARMRHIGKTQIEIFSRFTAATGNNMCPDSNESD